MKIFEMFHGKIPNVHWTKHGPMNIGSFEIDNKQYVIQFIKMSKNDPIHSAFPKSILTKDTWFFAFAAMIDGQLVDTDVKGSVSDALLVFSTVIQSLEQFITKHNVDTLYLGCSDKHKILKSIYKRLIDRYTKTYNWAIENTETSNFFGDNKFVWIIRKEISK